MVVKVCSRCRDERECDDYKTCKFCREWVSNYYKKHKDLANAKSKRWRENNPEKVREMSRKKYEENKEKIKERVKAYTNANRKKINEKAKEKATCECGVLVRKKGLKRHRQTKKHKKLMEGKNSTI